MKPALLISFFFLGLLFTQKSEAYDFSPIIAQFEPSGAGASRNFVIRNTHPEPIALQIEVFRRLADEFGNEVREPDVENFVVAPPQLVLAAGASQTVRVIWVGSPDVTNEQAFRIIVRQLPIRFNEAESTDEVAASISIGYTYEAAVYVAPRNALPEAVLTDAQPFEDTDGSRKLRLTLRSTGTTRAILENPRLRLTAADGTSIELSEDQLSPLQLRNILSGTQVVVDLSWPSELTFSPVRAQFETRYLAR